MPIQFTVGAMGPATKRRVRLLPTYSVTDWRLAVNARDRLVYRPGLKTFLRRLVFSALMLLIAWAFHYGYRDVVEPRVLRDPETVHVLRKGIEETKETASEVPESVRGLIEEGRWQAPEAPQSETRTVGPIEQRINEVEAKADAIRLARKARQIHWFFVTPFLILAAAPLLACLWNRVSVEQDVRNNLIVKSWILIPRTRVWPVQAFGSIAVMVQEVILHSRGLRRAGGWRWRGRLSGRADTASRGSMERPVAPVPWGVEFWIDHHWRRPTKLERIPERVAHLVGWLHQVTGLPVEQPLLLEHGMPHPTGERMTYEEVRARPGQRQRFESIEEIPPAYREKVKRMLEEARESGQLSAGGSVSQTITIRDAQGREETYHSIEEMPPDVRAHYERMLQMRNRQKP